MVGILGRGGGRCPIVYLAGVYSPLCWCWFRSWSRCLLGQGGGRDREMELGVVPELVWCGDLDVLLLPWRPLFHVVEEGRVWGGAGATSFSSGSGGGRGCKVR
jgi:hypothetical protein